MDTIVRCGAVPGANEGRPAVVDWGTGALRASVCPLQHVNNGITWGHYSFATQIAIGAGSGAGSGVLNLLWTAGGSFAPDALRRGMMVVERIGIGLLFTGTAIATQEVDMDVVVYRRITSFPVSPTSGSRVRATMVTPRATVFTSNSVPGGVPDSRPFAVFSANASSSAGNFTAGDGVPVMDIHNVFTGSHPVVCGPGEGITFRNITAAPSGSGVHYYMRIDWAEGVY